MVCIPIPPLYKLRVSFATKLGLGIALSVCVGGVVSAVMRLASFLAVESFNDFTYENVKPLSWTIAESGIYMVAGVLLTLRPLMRKVFGNVKFEKILSGRFRVSRSGKSSASEDSRGHKSGGARTVEGDEATLVSKDSKFATLVSKGSITDNEDEEKGI